MIDPPQTSLLQVNHYAPQRGVLTWEKPKPDARRARRKNKVESSCKDHLKRQNRSDETRRTQPLKPTRRIGLHPINQPTATTPRTSRASQCEFSQKRLRQPFARLTRQARIDYSLRSAKEMKPKLLYVEHKSGYSDDGPAWVGKGTYSKSGRTIYFNGQAFQTMKGAGIGASHYDLNTAEEYWISGVKKNEENRHWAGSGKVMIDREVVDEYLKVIEKSELNKSQYEIIEFSKDDIKSKTLEGQNQPLLDNA